MAEWGPGANCDAIVISDDAVVAIDLVYRQFTKESSGTGDLSHLAEDLRRAAVNKSMQIDGSLRKGPDGGHLAPDAIYPVVVVGGPFPVNPLL